MGWKKRPFRERTGATVLALLVGLDQLVQTILVAPVAIWGRCDVPDPDETLSSVLGRRVRDGNRWAIPFAAAVDAMFLLLTLGKEREHCARSIRDPARRGAIT